MEARLVTLLRETFVELDDLWRSIGLTAKERSEQVESLFKDTCELCRSRIATEKALAISYDEEVKRLKEDIAICAERLDVVRTAPPPTTEKLPLVRELTQLRGDYEELDRRRNEMETKMMERLSLLHACWDLMREPYEPGFETVGFKLSSKRANEIEHKYDEVRKERDRRRAALGSRFVEATQLMEMLELDENPQTPEDRAILTRNEEVIGLGLDSLEALDKRILELQTERQSKEAVLMRMITEIQSLWQRLDVPVPERESFIKRHSTLGMRSVHAFEEELARLKGIRRERMAEFIESVRVELRGLMEEARVATSERTRLNALMTEEIHADDYDACADLLARHDTELDRLTRMVDAVRPIVKICQKYLQLCKERIEYEALIQDSSRLLSRKKGSSLQEEEKMRKRVADMPKVITQLKQLVEDFQTHFLDDEKLIMSDILGEDLPVLTVVENTEHEHDERVQREKEQRNQKKHENVAAPLAGKRTATAPVAASTIKRAPMKPKN